MFRRIRVALLLMVLFGVGVRALQQQHRVASWNSTLQVVIYPIVGESSDNCRQYVQELTEDRFEDAQNWLLAEALRYGVQVSRPFSLKLGPVVEGLPPSPPTQRDIFAIMVWSLKLRYWVHEHDPLGSAAPQVRLYVIYHDPAAVPAMPDSLGIHKGMIGVVHAYATRGQTRQNNIVLVHELLHTLGASDKYDLETHLPHFPEGYADPARTPLWPQDQAEIMAGRIALNEHEARMPERFAEVTLGPETAREIGWLPVAH